MTTWLWQALPLHLILVSLVTAVAIFVAGEQRQLLRTILNLGGAIFKLVLVGVMLVAVAAGETFEFRMPLIAGLDLVLKADALTMLFVTLSALLWLITTIYAIGYLEGQANRARFFGFFSLCVMATMGIATAGNLLTFFVFYELLTLATWPLVVHNSTPEAMRGGRTYLRYLLPGGGIILLAVIWLYGLAGAQDFIAGGTLADIAEGQETQFFIIGCLLIFGLGFKCALVPVHGWLPKAMVAPAPVSALLHAVAVVKAGAFGMIRIFYDVFGIDLARDLGLTSVLAAAAAVTIIYGSVLALAQNDIKKRLAYSTVSQVSYILIGVAVAGPLASIGGLVHLVNQGLMKITLFFCAGNFAETLGVKKIEQLDGCGRRLPWTSVSFTIGALGMIGLPPVAGFVSKWYLGAGAIEAGLGWVLGVLVVSTLLNAAYFLPLLYRIWLKPGPDQWPDESVESGAQTRYNLLVPTVVVALFSLGAGLFAGLQGSPLNWAQLIVGAHYE